MLAAGYPAYAASPGSQPNYAHWLGAALWCETLSTNEMDYWKKRFHRDVQSWTVSTGRERRPATAEELATLFSSPEMVQKVLDPVVGLPWVASNNTLDHNLRPGDAKIFLSDPEFTQAFFTQLSPRDCLPIALRILSDIREQQPEYWKEYRKLTVAVALVFDQKPPGTWPHDQVPRAVVPLDKELKPDTHFAYWCEANNSKKLLLDLKKMEVQQLVFVVDSFVEKSELEWAQKNLRYTRATLPSAFSDIRYDNDRIKQQQYDWPHSDYSLSYIKRVGGICVDQAYYAATVGKAKGLPTLFFSGQGADGGHAWFGYMKSDDLWDMNCGRYKSQNYAVGEALNPQTWEAITDHELGFLAKRFRDTPAYATSQIHLQVARWFELTQDSAKVKTALDNALRSCPDNPEAWDAKANYLDTTGALFPEKKTHLDAAIQKYSSNADLKTTYQERLANLHRAAGNEAAAAALEKNIVSSNRTRRSDIAVTQFSDKLKKLSAEGKLDEAFAEYRKQMPALGRTGGGSLFYDAVRPLAFAYLDAGNWKQCEKTLEIARRSLAPDKGSILDEAMAEIESEIKAAKLSKK